MILYRFVLFKTSQIALESMGVMGIVCFVRVSEAKVKVNTTSFIQSFIQFSRHKRLKKDNWMVLYRITSCMLCNSMLHYVGPLVSWSVGCAGWSVGWSPFFFLAI